MNPGDPVERSGSDSDRGPGGFGKIVYAALGRHLKPSGPFGIIHAQDDSDDLDTAYLSLSANEGRNWTVTLGDVLHH